MNKPYAVIDGAGPDLTIRAFCHVENVIVIDPEQAAEMQQAFGKPVIPCMPLDLTIGDLYNGERWTRNVDGVMTDLPVEEASRDVDEMIQMLYGAGGV